MILIGSPSKALRQRWRDALAGSFPMHEISEKHALLCLLQNFKPSALFLDYETGEPRKIALLRDILHQSPSLRVVVFATRPTLDEGVAAIMTGAKGYAPKDLSKPLIRKAARVVSRGELWIGHGLVLRLIDELVSRGHSSKGMTIMNFQRSGENSSPVLNRLSPRECQIASLIGTGKHNKAISGYLNISEKTVKAHITIIFRKLGLSSRTQLALAVSQNPSVHKYHIRSPAEASLNLSRIEQ